jgi:hypothetical protein
MNDEEKEARTFTEEQQKMFGDEEAYQTGAPVRPRTPGVTVPPEPDIGTQEVTGHKQTEADMAAPYHEVVAARGEGGAEITGGTDKYGPGGLGDKEHHTHETGASETGDIAGASSTHAGAGGEIGQTGGTGTAPNTVGQRDKE